MTTTVTRQETGRSAEEFAAQFVSRTLGWTVLERNWRCRFGELDIVADERGTLVVVEVRSRSGDSFGSPAESVLGRKTRQLERLLPFLLVHLHRRDDQPLRIDALCVWMQGTQVRSFEHIRNLSL